MVSQTSRLGFAGVFTACALALLLVAQAASAIEISFRSFSGAAALGPPADDFAAKLQSISATVLGKDGEIKFSKIKPMPAIPKEFKNIGAAVAAGGPLAGGKGFDAAYISGSDLNPAWGFIYNSGIPFGPIFDEFIGFLYGKSIDGKQTGLDLLHQILDAGGKNFMAIPICGSCQQGSGYFMKPVGPAGSEPGIGLAGLCQQTWTFRYLPPAQYVLDRACDNLVASGAIPKKNIKFITALAGGGSLVKAVKDGEIQAFEFATPVDDVSTLFGAARGKSRHRGGSVRPLSRLASAVPDQLYDRQQECLEQVDSGPANSFHKRCPRSCRIVLRRKPQEARGETQRDSDGQ